MFRNLLFVIKSFLLHHQKRTNVAKCKNHCVLSYSGAIARNVLYTSNISVKRIFRYTEMRAASRLLGGCCCGWRIKLTSWRCSQRENDLPSTISGRRSTSGMLRECKSSWTTQGPLTSEQMLVDIKWIEFVQDKFNILSF